MHDASDQSRPEVIVDIVFEDGLFHVAIENIGQKPAREVSVRFHPTFRGAGGHLEVSALPLFRRIPFLAPRRRITTFVDTSSAYFARCEPTDITATVTYTDAAGAEYTDTIPHDLAIYKDVFYLRRPGDPEKSE
jgi:hypothetical protein